MKIQGFRGRGGTRAWRLVLVTLGAFAALTPTASADTTLPVWSCRASAAYVELNPVLGTQRIEPVLANGFPNRVTPDTGQCASDDSGVQDVMLPASGLNPLVSLNSAFATTRISPEISAARGQSVTASGGVVDTLRIELGGLVITARAVSAQASAGCNATTPVMTATSTVVELTVGGTVIAIPTGGQPLDLNLTPLIRVRLNERVQTGNALSADESLTARAAHIEVLPSATQPLANVVIGEAKVDRHGAVCAAAPPPPTCPAGSTPQTPGATPLVCVQVVTPPCPPGATPNAAGACVVTVVADPGPCPAGTVRDPNSTLCILLVQRPCPAGATPDPATRVCVVTGPGTTTGSGTENGRIGTPTGPRATCGRLRMRFVRGGGRTLTNKLGIRVVTRGRLVTCGSRPQSIIGARVDVIHVLPDGRRLRKTGLRSRARGRLTLILPNDLRSRRIEFAYRPDLSTTRVTSRVFLRLIVKNRRGQVIR